ncbi:MAG TPA: DinB family protein [Saprospiraceae bacterium]|nr:DinB family protein [Saprospiraceae bacterium]
MNRFILLFCAFLLCLSAKAQDSYLQEFQQKWANAKAYTLELAQAMPEEYYDFKPTEEQMSFKRQLLHTASNMVWLSSAYLNGKKLEADLRSDDYTKAEVIELLERSFNNAAAAVIDFPVEELKTEVKFFAGPMSKRQIIVLMNDHVVHHRGQMIVYARLKGIEPPKFRGW